MDTKEIQGAVKRLRTAFNSGRTRPIEWRLRQLKAIKTMIKAHQEEIIGALGKDLGKPPIEALVAEVSFMVQEVDHFRKALPGWMKPEKVSTPLPVQPGKSQIVREPYGVALIIAPWNYPFQLTMSPLAGAIAAGNCAILKPSEITPHTSAIIAKLVPQYMDPDCVAVVEGAVPETTALLNEQFDYIFYTGNGTVGRIVMEAAAKNLTPLTLELGGKSPTLVDKDVDLDVAARRIAWAKFFNAGQTCVAPDYVLAHEAIESRLVDKLRATVKDFYGEDPKKSPDFTRIVNSRHVQRLSKLLGSGDVVTGGDYDAGQNYLAPTILRNVREDSPVMQDEIFGPILPVLKVQNMDAAVEFVNKRPKPLALYVYSSNSEVQKRVIERTSSGGAAINHSIVHLSVPGLPFGGVGPSGMGAYHGRHSFETFSHRKSVLRKPFAFDAPILYPPYTESKTKWLKKLL